MEAPSAPFACPSCSAINAPASTTCGSCGAAIGVSLNDAATVGLPSIESDPEVVELWHHLRDATLGEYDIYAPIGRGGMATVFLALDLALEREVAIKVISPAMLHTKSLVDRFKREARTAANLSHPNIIPVHQVKEVDGLVFFVMKYVDGRSLDAIIKEEGPLSLDVSLKILEQVGHALHFAHRKGVVHRDVKPANIMIDQDGWTIVTDFGIAKVTDAGALTSAGVVVGTPAYMSPEQFEGTAVTGAADQYSLGVVAYEMMTGKKPYSANSLADMMRAHFMDEPVAPETLRPGLPKALADVILRMMRKDSGERWPSVGDAVDALEPLSRARADEARAAMIVLSRSGSAERPRISVPVSPSPTRRTIPPPLPGRRSRIQRARSRRNLGVAAGVTTLAVAALLLTRPWQSSSPPPTPAPVAQAPKSNDVEAGNPGTSPALGASNSIAVKDSVSAPPTRQTPQAVPRTTPSRSSKRTDGAQGRSSADLQDAKTKAAGGASSEVQNRLPVSPPPAPVETAATPPVVVPPPPVNGVVHIGTRIPNAVLYVNDKTQGFIQGLKYLTFKAGSLHLRIQAEGCSPWDSTFNVPAGDTVRVGFRSPTCAP